MNDCVNQKKYFGGFFTYKRKKNVAYIKYNNIGHSKIINILNKERYYKLRLTQYIYSLIHCEHFTNIEF